MKISIKDAQVWKTGDSAVITIPSSYIKNGQLVAGKSYDIVVEVPDESPL